jgi:hypothetical protein
MSVKATASTAAANWQTGFSGASTKYVAGVNAVTVAPGQLAAANKSGYLSGVQQNADIWASKVAAVDLGTWKNAAATTGAARLATGATKGLPKMQAFMNNFLPVLSGVVSSLPQRGTFEQNMQRSMAFAQQLHQKKGSF